jgi:hypothetical protein
MAIYTARVSGAATASNAARTMVQVVAGSTKRVKVKEFSCSFDGADSTKTPVLVELLRETTAGTSSALTIVENEEALESPIATALQTFTATDPTAGDILFSAYVTPAGGLLGWQYPLGDEPVVAPSGRIAVRVTTVTASGTPNCAAFIRFEE